MLNLLTPCNATDRRNVDIWTGSSIQLWSKTEVDCNKYCQSQIERCQPRDSTDVVHQKMFWSTRCQKKWNIIYQNNKSTITLENHKPSSKNAKYIKVRYFYQGQNWTKHCWGTTLCRIEQDDIQVQHCTISTMMMAKIIMADNQLLHKSTYQEVTQDELNCFWKCCSYCCYCYCCWHKCPSYCWWVLIKTSLVMKSLLFLMLLYGIMFCLLILWLLFLQWYSRDWHLLYAAIAIAVYCALCCCCLCWLFPLRWLFFCFLMFELL